MKDKYHISSSFKVGNRFLPFCGTISYDKHTVFRFTGDIKKVTCKRCLKKLEKNEMKLCPSCKLPYVGYPALSRKDNKTDICSTCGQKEAIEAAFKGVNK